MSNKRRTEKFCERGAKKGTPIHNTGKKDGGDSKNGRWANTS